MNRKRKKISRADGVKNILNEAERFHLLACPVADPFHRTGAMLLDFILVFLLGSGVDHAGNAFYSHLINLPFTLSFSERMSHSVATAMLVDNAEVICRYIAIGSKISFLIFAFGWLVNQFGGSPAQLLIGLRVVDQKSGDTLQINQALFRQVSLIALSPLFPMVFFRKDRRAAHDLITQTSVRKVHGVR